MKHAQAIMSRRNKGNIEHSIILYRAKGNFPSIIFLKFQSKITIAIHEAISKGCKQERNACHTNSWEGL